MSAMANASEYTIFTYGPLATASILLLTILKGDRELDCKLQGFPLKQSLSFHAVSYCWDKEQETASIICYGKRLSITLHTALNTSVHRFRPRYCGSMLYVSFRRTMLRGLGR